MRVAAAALSMLGALVSLYVPVAAYLSTGFPTPPAFSMLGALVNLSLPVTTYQNNLSAGFPTPAFFGMGAAFALVGAAAGLLIWRGRKLGPWLLVLGTIGGLVAWPWFTTGIIYLLATAVSVVSLRMVSRPTGTTGKFARL